MRRRNGLVGLALVVVGLAGCHKPFFINELDYVYYNEVSGDYQPAKYTDVPNLPTGIPRTVRDPAATEKWNLTLGDAKRIALENNKQIAYLGYQPGQAATAIDTALSVFDTIFEAGGGWGRTDRQVNNLVQTFGTDQSALVQKLFGGQAGYGVNTSNGAALVEQNPGYPNQAIPGANVVQFSKRNAAGGVTNISYNLNYSNTRPVSDFVAVNPAWTSEVTLGFQQPLLQQAGVEVNRAPILIARATHEQSIKQFETSIHTLLRDVELQYWQLYFAYQDLYSRETGMKQALATWQRTKNELEVGTKSPPDVAQAREQYEFFRAAMLQAMNRLLTAERELRSLMGIAPFDDKQIIPADEPVIAEYMPDWRLSVEEAMTLRPELAAQRFAIRGAELELMRQKNGLLPDLTVNGSYALSGLDNQWDQSIDRMTDHSYEDWFLGLRYRRQIGERTANAAVQRAKLTLAQQRATLRNVEHTVLHELDEAYQNLVTNYELIQVQKARREAAARQLEARVQFYKLGKTTIDLLLQSQTTFADALRDESQAIVTYNQALITWQYSKGTILLNDNVVLAEELAFRTDPKVIDYRSRQYQHSIPVPIHKGKKVHDEWSDPTKTEPLYPQLLPTEPDVVGPQGIINPNAPAVPGSLPARKADQLQGPVEPMLAPDSVGGRLPPADTNVPPLPRPRNSTGEGETPRPLHLPNTNAMPASPGPSTQLTLPTTAPTAAKPMVEWK